MIAGSSEARPRASLGFGGRAYVVSVPPSVPGARGPAQRRDASRADGLEPPTRARVREAVVAARRRGPVSVDAGHEGEAVQHDRALVERGVAAAQPAEAAPLGSAGSALRVAPMTSRRRSTSASSTATSVRPGRPREPGGACTSARRVRRHRGRLERVGRVGARATRSAREEAADGAGGAVAEVAAEHRVSGEGHHLDRGVRYLRPRPGGRRWWACAGPARRRGSASGRSGSPPFGRAARRRVGPGRAGFQQAEE